MKKPHTTRFAKCLQLHLLFKCILVCTVFVLSNFAAQAQCSASFSYSQTASTIYFNNTSSTANSFIYRSIWDFGDGSSLSYTKNPSHNYVHAGTYYVTLIMQGDSVGYCRDTITDSVVVIEKCDAGYSYTTNGYNATFTAKTNFSSKTYYWQLRDYANFALVADHYGASFTYKFSSAGQYYVQLAVSDSALNCLDSGIYKLFTITAPSCTPNFNAQISGYDVNFYASPQMGKTFVWSYGDGISSTTLDSFRTHQYGSTGTYWACLTAIDSANSCKDSMCRKIVIVDTSCNANFQYTVQGSRLDANATSGSISSTKYTWTLDDTVMTTTGKQFSQYLTHDGTHKLCLTVSKANCYTTHCEYINMVTCKADFYDTITGLYVDFINTSQWGSRPIYYWSFGDGTSSTDSMPSHTYSTSGTYNVCLIMNDTARGCIDTICKQVTVKSNTPPQTCDADFTISVSGKKIYIFPTNNGSGTTYKWSMGDTSSPFTRTQYDSMLTYTYAANDSYTVCLKVSRDSCSDSVCKTVVINVAPQTYAVYGNIYLGNTSTGADVATVYLITYNPADSMLSAIDSASVSADSSGMCHYIFSGLSNGTYYVKAGLNSSSSYYADYFPTYHDSLLEWANASGIIVNNANESANIYLVQGNNPGGSAFIGGKVIQGSFKKEGDPLEHIQVMLFDANRNPVAYTYSNAKGEFSFNNLAFGTYEVYTEVIGVITNSGFVTLSETNPRVEDVTVKVSSSGITTGIRTKLTEDFLAQPKLYPNPAQNNLYLETDMKKSQATEIVIYNITGQQVYSENIDLKQGKQIHNIATEKLPAGLYMLQLKNASGTSELQYKFIKTSK
jgi:PKD repeat protein